MERDMKRSIHPFLALMILLIALPAPTAWAAPAAQEGVCAKGASVAIREGPGGGYRRLGAVVQGECVTVIGLSPDGQWYQIPGGWVWAAPYLWSTTGSSQPQPASNPVPAPAPAPATSSAVGGHRVEIESWVTDPAASPFSDVVVFAIVNIDGGPRAGIPVSFAWGTTPASACTAVTGPDGLAFCLQNTGASPSGQTILIQGSLVAYGRSYTTLTSVVPNGDCDPAYPDFCLERSDPAVKCSDIPYRNFLVLPPDPRGFDPDGDSVGCPQ
jgi:Bacterial SH3 domain